MVEGSEVLPFEEPLPLLGKVSAEIPDETPKVLLPQPAGFLRRVIAFFLDLMVIGGLYLVVVTVGILALRRAAGEAVSLSTVGAFSVIVVPFIAAWFSLFIGYFSFFHGNGGQTPGKRLIRIKVITSDGIPLSPVRSFLRSFGYFLSSSFFGFGFLMAIFGKKKRALHDLLARTEVVLE